MEGTPVRRPQRLSATSSLIDLNGAQDLNALRRTLTSLVSEQLEQSDVVVGILDSLTGELQLEPSRTWLKSLISQPALLKKLSNGDLVGLNSVELSTPHPASSARSTILLIPMVADSALVALIAIVTPNDISQPSAEDIEFARTAGHAAAPLIVRLDELERLRAENEAFNGTLQMRGHFQSNIAHELRTPLAAIRGYTRMILDGRAGEVNNTQKEYLTVVTENANRMIHLVNWMSHVLDRSAQNLRLSTVDLTEVWNASLKKNEKLFRERKITVKEHITDEPFVITADQEKLATVFDTLLRSAAKFTTDAGYVTVHITHGRERDVTVKMSISGNGIPLDILKTIFDRPISAGLDRGIAELDFPGVHDVIGMHGGRLFVNSKPGEGSTFIFTLPAVTKDGEEKLSHEQTVYSGRRRR